MHICIQAVVVYCFNFSLQQLKRLICLLASWPHWALFPHGAVQSGGCAEWGPLFSAVKGLLLLSSTGCADEWLRQASLVALRHVGSSGIDRVSPASTGGFLITGPPVKSQKSLFYF